MEGMRRGGEVRDVFMAFGTAEFEDAGVVADEGYAFGGVAWLGAEVACLDSVGRLVVELRKE